jgi:hypothetical protein
VVWKVAPLETPFAMVLTRLVGENADLGDANSSTSAATRSSLIIGSDALTLNSVIRSFQAIIQLALTNE